MAKKGREARISRTIAAIRKEEPSEALKRRARGRGSARGWETSSGASRTRARKDKARARAEARGTRDSPHGYHGALRVLMIGDGNLTFALALTTLTGGDGRGVVATTNASAEANARRHGSETKEALEACGARVVFGVECENLKAKAKALVSTKEGFDRVVFNFPDCGFGRVGAMSVRAQRELLTSFFVNAPGLLKANGEMHVTLQTGAPYSLWNIEGVGMKAGVVLKTVIPFQARDFPGYQYCRTATEDDDDDVDESHDEDIECECMTYIFVKGSGAVGGA